MANNVPVFAQQGVTSLNPGDTLSLMQGRSARPLRLPIFVLLNHIKTQLAADDALMTSIQSQIDTALTAMESKADDDHTHIMEDIVDLEATMLLKADITALAAGLAAKAALSHTHTAAQITDFTTSVNSLVTTAINNLVNGAPAALDTLKEIADRLASDESAVTALASVVSGKANASHTHIIADVTGLSSALAAKADASALSSYATTSALTTGLAGKANASHTHVIADVTGLQTALDTKAVVYNGTTQLSKPVVFTGSLTLATAGTGTINLTADATTGGTALFANINNVQVTVNDATTVWPCSWSVSANKKVLTVTVNKAATPLLSLLGINILAAPTAAPIGTVVQVLAFGN